MTLDFACNQAGHAMIMQARLCAGYAPEAKQSGIWPAYWALGQSIREGIPWPGCGEIDIYEAAGGQPYTLATLHYSDASNRTHFQTGGFGIAQQNVSFNRFSSDHARPRIGASEFHTFALTVDRRASSWQQESMSWSIDGRTFYRVTGSQFTYDQWATLAHKPFFPIFNVAVGTMIPVGDQQPNADTGTGLPVGMQVDYVAVYYSD